VKSQPEFARVFGRVPRVKDGEAFIHAYLDEIVGAFGPPEIQVFKSSRRLFWNFQTRDDVGRFSLWVEIPAGRKSTNNLDVEVSTEGLDWEKFFDWSMDRLGAVSGCVEPPVAINGAGFVVVPA
jgi:hypothetical protein